MASQNFNIDNLNRQSNQAILTLKIEALK